MTNKTSQKKEYIKSTALGLFKDLGYDNVSVNDICKACQISKTNFYYHFKSKNELLNYYFRTKYKDPRDLLEYITLNNTVDKLWKVYNEFFKNALHMGPDMLKHVIKANLDEGEGAFTLQGGFADEICVELIKQAQNSGEIGNPYDAETLNEAYGMAIKAILLEWSIVRGSYDINEKAWRLFVATFNLRGQPKGG